MPVRIQRRDQARIDATAEHRAREDAAARLCDEIPSLRSLRLHMHELRENGAQTGLSYSKVVVLNSAPAFFEVRCFEPRCDGRYDLTDFVLRGLRSGQESFRIERSCQGAIEQMGCHRAIACECEATYA